MAIPNKPLVTLGAPSSFDLGSSYPLMQRIRAFNSVGPDDSNRQHVVADQRTETLRGKINQMMQTINFINGVDVDGASNLYADGGPYYLARDGTSKWLADNPLDMNGAQIKNIEDATDDQDVVSLKQLTRDWIKADGSRAYDGGGPSVLTPLQMGGCVIRNVGTPIQNLDVVRKVDLDSMAQELQDGRMVAMQRRFIPANPMVTKKFAAAGCANASIFRLSLYMTIPNGGVSAEIVGCVADTTAGGNVRNWYVPHGVVHGWSTDMFGDDITNRGLTPDFNNPTLITSNRVYGDENNWRLTVYLAANIDLGYPQVMLRVVTTCLDADRGPGTGSALCTFYSGFTGVEDLS